MSVFLMKTWKMSADNFHQKRGNPACKCLFQISVEPHDLCNNLQWLVTAKGETRSFPKIFLNFFESKNFKKKFEKKNFWKFLKFFFRKLKKKIGLNFLEIFFWKIFKIIFEKKKFKNFQKKISRNFFLKIFLKFLLSKKFKNIFGKLRLSPFERTQS